MRYCWGLFGLNDELGCLNLLTADRMRRAAQLVKSGRRISLSLPLNEPDPPPGGRSAYRRTQIEGRFHSQDEFLDGFHTQASSQWDGFRHMPAGRYGWYNGFDERAVGPNGDRLGIEHFARHGIAGRGVLLDAARFLDLSGSDSVAISADDLNRVLDAEGVTLAAGDILLLRSGWLRDFRSRPPGRRAELVASGAWAGLHAGESMARYLWDHHVAAVVGDSPTLEVAPGNRADGFLHRRLIPLLGIAIGELWDLDDLSLACEAEKRYEFMVVSAPLFIPGGTGSPANALAIL